ncbi:MAG: hypothetical protein EPN26_06605 [Rhodospirillales bacterium]|nr:MAG: hypothetical protein EPN26_06605 [Rhodospirillales bacterium]
MTYEIQIRHSRPVAGGDGFEHSLECLRVEAGSEEEAVARLHLSCNDHIACVDAWHHRGIAPYSVDTGELEFFTDAARPPRPVGNGEARTG